MERKDKKAFTLIELIVTLAVLGILVLLASPRFFGHTQNAELTRGFANARSIEKASELYYMDNNDWPRLTDDPYTSEEIESYSERIFNHTGQEVNLNPDGNYYDIDYDKLSDYIQVPDDKKNYILQNPVGKVFYMENLNEAGAARVNYSSTKEDDNSIPIGEPDGSGDEGIPDNYEIAELEDFEFVTNSSAPNEYHGNRGYYRYVGDKEYVIIPHIIQDVELKDYYRMFDGSTVKGVASDNKNVTDMSWMFYNSSSITIELKYLDTSSVTNMNRMFERAQSTTLDLSSFDTSSVTNMNYMFRNSQATTLDLSSFDTSSVTSMGSMFRDSQATTLDLSSFDTSSVTSTGSMFQDSQATIGYARTAADAGKFTKSSSKPLKLTFVVKDDLDKPQPPTNKPDGYVIAKQEDFLFVVSNNAPNVYNETKGYYNYVGSDDKIVIPHIIHGNEIKDYYRMFAGSNVKGVASDNKNVANMSAMFESSNSTSIELKYLDTSSATNMDYMFRSSKATTLDLRSFDTSSVTSMTQMFQSSQATTLDLRSFDTSSVTSMNQMFRISRATTLDLSSFDTSKVTDVRYMFWDSEATTGYARTQVDANKFNNSSYKPKALIFDVK